MKLFITIKLLNYEYALLFKSSHDATSLLKRSTFVPVFDNQKKSQVDFCFH